MKIWLIFAFALGVQNMQSERIEDTCAICFGDLSTQPEGHLDSIPFQEICKNHHCFHSCCARPWLRSHSTCPTCREEITNEVKDALGINCGENMESTGEGEYTSLRTISNIVPTEEELAEPLSRRTAYNKFEIRHLVLREGYRWVYRYEWGWAGDFYQAMSERERRELVRQ